MSEEGETPLFGVVERRLFRVTVVLSTAVVLLGVVAGIVWILSLTLSFFYALVMPLSVAGILALMLYPVVDSLQQRTRIPRVAATSIILLLVLAAIVGVAGMVVPTLIREIGQITEMIPTVLKQSEDYLKSYFPGIARMLADSAQDGDIKEMMPGLEKTGETMRYSAGVMAGLSFVPLVLFFFLLSGQGLRDNTMDALSVFSARTQQKVMYFIEIFLAQLTGFFQGKFVISIIMGVMLAVGFKLIGLQSGVVIGLVLGLLNIVPFLGTLVGLLIVLPLAFFQASGGLQLLGLSVLVFSVVQLVESWLLTPKIMANRSGLHPALVVVSVFFWGTALGGVTGMILAVPLTAFLVAVWRQVKSSLTLSMQSDDEVDRIESPNGNRHTQNAQPDADLKGNQKPATINITTART